MILILFLCTFGCWHVNYKIKKPSIVVHMTAISFGISLNQFNWWFKIVHLKASMLGTNSKRKIIFIQCIPSKDLICLYNNNNNSQCDPTYMGSGEIRV